MPRDYRTDSYPALDFDRSVELDGSTLWLSNDNDIQLGLVNNWSIGMWIRIKSSATHYLLNLAPISGANNSVLFWITSTQLNITLRDEDNSPLDFQAAQWASAVTTDTWYHLVITWDGTDLKLFRDASEIIATTVIVDASGTMAIDTKRIFYGATVIGTLPFDGFLGPLALWRTILDSDDMTEIHNPATGTPFEIDLTSNVGGYDKAGDCFHFWRPNTRDPGITDQGIATGINFNDATVSKLNISTETPA